MADAKVFYWLARVPDGYRIVKGTNGKDVAKQLGIDVRALDSTYEDETAARRVGERLATQNHTKLL